MKYGVFSDESKHTASRYRSIGAVSISVESYDHIDSRLKDILEDSEVREFKWQKTKGAKYRFCAQKLIDCVLNLVIPSGGRIDVLTWDTQDSRHQQAGRDDTKNFERMFFHLHRNLMQRYEFEAEWHIRPDERFDIDWDTIRDCLKATGNWQQFF